MIRSHDVVKESTTVPLSRNQYISNKNNTFRAMIYTRHPILNNVTLDHWPLAKLTLSVYFSPAFRCFVDCSSEKFWVKDQVEQQWLCSALTETHKITSVAY